MMNIDAFCQHLLKIYSATERERRLEMIVREIAAFFGVRSHEVGLFKIDPAGRNASLSWPPSRRGSMVNFPLKSFVTSLVALTIKDRQPRIDNTFADTNHLHMMERTPDDPEHRLPIQKIISVPAIWDNSVRWVIQVSRKGRTPDEAGADFTAVELDQLERIAATIGQLEL
ncbi:MAG: GAF domain-containing protein [Desulfuromonadales bacterium]|nr:GAF domain-containing protein [Desulfuromonadales bacterium]